MYFCLKVSNSTLRHKSSTKLTGLAVRFDLFVVINTMNKTKNSTAHCWCDVQSEIQVILSFSTMTAAAIFLLWTLRMLNIFGWCPPTRKRSIVHLTPSLHVEQLNFILQILSRHNRLSFQRSSYALPHSTQGYQKMAVLFLHSTYQRLLSLLCGLDPFLKFSHRKLELCMFLHMHSVTTAVEHLTNFHKHACIYMWLHVHAQPT